MIFGIFLPLVTITLKVGGLSETSLSKISEVSSLQLSELSKTLMVI